jgi:hypothetical protein
LSDEPLRDKIFRPQPKATEIAAELPPHPPGVPRARFAASDPADASVGRAMKEVAELMPDFATVAERYPLLRNEL